MYHQTETPLKKYYYLYIITNLINNKIYIGCHSTNDLNDNYMGSGLHIKRAIDHYGIENFSKQIISFFDNEDEMFAAEKKIVTKEFIKENNNYNLAIGGRGGNTGNYDSVSRSLKLSNSMKNKAMVKNDSGIILKVDRDDIRFVTKELVGHTSGKTVFKDINENIVFASTTDSRVLSGELVGITSGKCLMKDSNGNNLMVSKSDPRIKSGELVGITKGTTQTTESNEKRRASLLGRKKQKIMVTCIYCRKTTILINFIRWHKSCNNTPL